MTKKAVKFENTTGKRLTAERAEGAENIKAKLSSRRPALSPAGREPALSEVEGDLARSSSKRGQRASFPSASATLQLSDPSAFSASLAWPAVHWRSCSFGSQSRRAHFSA